MRDFAPGKPAGPDLRRLVEPHLRAIQILAAVNAATADAPAHSAARCAAQALLEAVGLAEATALADPAARRRVRAAIQAELRLALKVDGVPLDEGRPALNAALGKVSAGLPALLAREIVPSLDGLQARLTREGARLLDIGTGIGAFAIGMARLWPRLSVTGLEPLAAIADIARDEVATAGLADRIEIRTSRGEDLEERESYDLAFVPSAFIPRERMGRVMARAAEALRPGGWLLFAAGTDTDATAAALWRFRAASCGGLGLGPVEAACLLRRHGLADVRFRGFGPEATVGVAAGRRPEVG